MRFNIAHSTLLTLKPVTFSFSKYCKWRCIDCDIPTGCVGGGRGMAATGRHGLSTGIRPRKRIWHFFWRGGGSGPCYADALLFRACLRFFFSSPLWIKYRCLYNMYPPQSQLLSNLLESKLTQFNWKRNKTSIHPRINKHIHRLHNLGRSCVQLTRKSVATSMSRAPRSLTEMLTKERK